MTGTQHAGIVMGSSTSGVVRFNQFAECYLSRLLTALIEYLIVLLQNINPFLFQPQGMPNI